MGAVLWNKQSQLSAVSQSSEAKRREIEREGVFSTRDGRRKQRKADLNYRYYSKNTTEEACNNTL